MKCKNCKEDKKWDQYFVDPSKKNGLSTICLDCFNKVKEIKDIKRASYLRKLNKIEQDKRTYYLRVYNISSDQYNELFILQEGKCLICGTHQSELDRALCVDHDHTTNKIRGLLCGNCNSGLGFFKENINLLLRAINYLTI